MKRQTMVMMAAWAVVLGACSQAPGYKLTGTVEGAQDGDTVKIYTYNEQWQAVTLQETVVKNNTFVMTGRKDTAALYYIACAHDGQGLGNTQFVLENGDIQVDLTPDPNVCYVKGTPTNDAWCAYYNEESRLCSESMDLYRALQDATLSEEVRVQKQELQAAKDKEIVAHRLRFCRENVTNIAGVSVLTEFAKDFAPEEVEALLMQIPAEYKTEGVIALETEINNKKGTAIGQPFTDFSMLTPDGKTLSVSEVAGANKVTMIDFWASWCGPCRAEMPYVKKAYAAYHDKGFEIIGVSLDNNADAWKKAIADLELPWPQISDLQGWKCAGAELYGVKAIPATVLIQDGKIVARDLREEAIAEKLAELLD